MSDTTSLIKERISIVDVVTPYVKLVKTGKYYKGLSPFTQEKTPSFFVSPDRGLYHCFSSGKGGDMFTFVQELEGVDFRGALKILADKAGVPITNEPKEKKDLRDKLYALLDEAQEFYQTLFVKNKEVQKYVEERGVREETYKKWGIGYAPQEWRGALEYLVEKGHSESHLIEAGLIKRPESEEGADTKKPYDRFRSRVMFPLMDISGRVVGFSGRAYGPEGEHPQAKYLNSPETQLFDKSRFLYGLNFARDGIRKYDFSMLVEGQFDVLLAHQSGYTNTVAVSGTSFTEHHAQLLRRYSENLVIAFDADRAGVSASGRAAHSALDAGLNVKMALLPEGEDPADIIQRDPALWKEIVRGAQHVIDFYITHIQRFEYDARREKLEISRVVLPYVARVKNAIDRAHFVQKVAETLSVPERAVEIELEKITRSEKKEPAYYREDTKGNEAEAYPGHSQEPFLSREDTLERLLIGVMQALSTEAAHESYSTRLEKRLRELLGSERIEQVLTSPEESRVSIIEGDLFLQEHDEQVDLESLVESLIVDLEQEMKKSNYHRTVALLRKAEQEGDEEKAKELLLKVDGLAKEL